MPSSQRRNGRAAPNQSCSRRNLLRGGKPSSSESSSLSRAPPTGPKALRDTSNVSRNPRNYQENNLYKKRGYSQVHQDDHQADDREPKKPRRQQGQKQRSYRSRAGDRRPRTQSHRATPASEPAIEYRHFLEVTDKMQANQAAVGAFAPQATNAFSLPSTQSGMPQPPSYPFGAPSGPSAVHNPPASQGFPSSTSSQPTQGLFGAPSTGVANAAQNGSTPLFGAPSRPSTAGPLGFASGTSSQPSQGLFSAPSTGVTNAAQNGFTRPFGAPSVPSTSHNLPGPQGISSSTSSQPTQGLFGTPSTGVTNAAQNSFTRPFGAPSGLSTSPVQPSPFNPFAPAPQVSSESNTDVKATTSETKKPFHNPFSPDSPTLAVSDTAPETSTSTTKASTIPQPTATSSTIPQNPLSVAQNSPVKPSGTPSASSTRFFSAPSEQRALQTRNGLPKSKAERLAEPPKASRTLNGHITQTITKEATTITNGTSSLESPSDSEPRITSDAMKQKIEAALRSRGIRKPPLPSVDFKANRAEWELFTKECRAFREQYQKVLIEAHIIDDPEVPKRLEDAFDFKGTCTTMCPDLEAAERIVERRHDQFEKDYLGNGSFSADPNPGRMVKKFGRSAAGQDERLPMEVRTVDALEKTLDHLVDDLLSTVDLPRVHEFIWDRTRAIRRDLVYPSYFTRDEMLQRNHILENIARFHVVALHQMSKESAKHASYDAHQEGEQLANTLISLRHSYEECMDRQIECENRAEFLAYFVLFKCQDPAILKEAQDWGFELWGKSEVFQIAVSLVEAYQNTWDTHGPLDNPATKGRTQFDIALCAFSKFFTIVEDSRVSYHMACFAEMLFNDVRKSTIKAILHAYRRQKDQTKDWTLSRLNAYLRFDDESEIVPWGEMHGLHFESSEEEEYLSFSASNLRDPWPKAPQQHSYDLVECKRGDYTLSELVRTTVFGTSDEDEYGPIAGDEDEGNYGPVADDEDDGLFVKDYFTKPAPQPASQPLSEPEEEEEDSNEVQQPNHESATPAVTDTVQNGSALASEEVSKSKSVFDRFGSPKAVGFPTLQDSYTPKEDPPSIFTKPTGTKTNPPFVQLVHAQSPAALSKPLFGFLSQPTATPESAANSTKPMDSLTTSQTSNQQAFETAEKAAAPKLSLFPTVDKSSIMSSPVQSPLSSNSSQANTASLTSTTFVPTLGSSLSAGPSLLSAPDATVDSSKPPKILAIANWVALGEGGLMDQFTEYLAEGLLHETAELFMAEQKQLAEKQAAEECRLQADGFRYRILASRYFFRWREAARKAGLKRRGREGRKRRREMANSQAAEKANIVDDFRASIISQQEAEEADRLEEFQNSTSAARRLSRERRESLESLLQDPAVQALIQEKVEKELNRRESSSKKRPRSEQSSDPVVSGIRHKRDSSDHPLSRSLLSDSKYLHGGSRIHLMSSYDDQIENRHKASGVQTDYFRLKARGISTVPDGGRSARKEIVHQKHTLDGITKSSKSKVHAWARNVTPKAVPEPNGQQPSVGYERHEELTNGIDSLLLKEKSKQNNVLDDFDKELFARCKQSREALGEGEEYRDISEELLEAEWNRVQSGKEKLKRQEDKVQAEWSRIQNEKKKLKRKSRSLS